MSSDEEVDTTRRDCKWRPLRIATLYSVCFLIAFGCALILVGVFNPSVFSVSFLLGALLIYGLPGSGFVGLFVLAIRSIRKNLSPVMTAILTATALCTITILVFFLPSLFSDNQPHFVSRFVLSIVVSSPILLGLAAAAMTAGVIEARLSKK